MTVLPIVGRELRVAARRRGMYLGRVGVAVAGLLLGTWLFVLPLPSPREQGTIIFTALAVFAFVCCGLAGTFTTADCLSAEKREGTLGLLFLTDLRSYDIVLGKLSASSLSVIYAVLALFPILGIPLLMGGVTLLEFVRVIVVALNTLFFSLSIGVFVSSVSRDDRRAMTCCFLMILFFAAGVPLLAALLDEWGFKRLSQLALVPSTTYSCLGAFEAAKPAVSYFRESLLTVHLMAWLFLALAVVSVRRVWQDKGDAGSDRVRGLKWFAPAGGPSGLAHRRELLGINAYYWLLARRPWQMRSGWGPLLLAGMFWTWGLAVYPRDWKDPSAYLMTAVLLHVIYKYWIATEAGRRTAHDRASGALELILSTPLSLADIRRGHQLGLNHQFFGPLLVLLVVDFVFLVSDQDEPAWVGMFVTGMILLVADYFTLTRLGLWMGACSRNPARAGAAVIVRVLVLPVVLYALMWTGLFLLAALGNSPPFRSIESAWFAIGTYLLLGLGVDAFFYVWATNKIEHQFREAATTLFQRGSKPRRRTI